MPPADHSRISLPAIHEITEEIIIRLRDHPESEASSHCIGNNGEHIGDMQVGIPCITGTTSVYMAAHSASGSGSEALPWNWRCLEGKEKLQPCCP